MSDEKAFGGPHGGYRCDTVERALAAAETALAAEKAESLQRWNALNESLAENRKLETALAEVRAERDALRPEVAAFALAMEQKLRENDHKGGWKKCTLAYLMKRLREETKELADAVSRRSEGWAAGKFRREAADVANFAMMIADVCGEIGTDRALNKISESVPAQTPGER